MCGYSTNNRPRCDALPASVLTGADGHPANVAEAGAERRAETEADAEPERRWREDRGLAGPTGRAHFLWEKPTPLVPAGVGAGCRQTRWVGLTY